MARSLSLLPFLALFATLVLIAATAGCTKSVEASQPPVGWQCHDDGTCSRVDAQPAAPFDPWAPREETVVIDGTTWLPPITIEIEEGCVPVDEPERLVFCEDEGLEVTVVRATALGSSGFIPPSGLIAAD